MPLRIPQEEPILVGMVVVNPEIALVTVERRPAVVEVVVSCGNTVNLREWIVLPVLTEEVSCHGSYRGARVSKVVERNIDIPLRRVSKLNATSTGAGTRSVERSTDVRAKLPKIAAPHALSEQLRSRSSCIHIPETLIVGEEEKLVLNNRSADGYSKLVVAKFGFEEGPVSRMTRDDMPRSVLVRSHTPRPAVGWKVGIEFVIAEKLVNRSVKAIRPSFGRYTDDATLVVAEFCR